jgi:SdpI/YfhL protein family
MLRQPFSIPALLILILSLPLILGLIPRNRVYGVRMSKTLSDDTVWYRANRFAGWTLLLASTIYLVIAVVAPNPSPPRDSLLIWLLHLGAFVGPLIASLLLVRSYVERL